MPGSEAWINRLSPYITDIFWRWEPGEKPSKVEVKYDILSQKTGRVALEHKALTKSTSDFVVYVVPPFTCLFVMADILAMIGNYPQVTGGDQPDNILTLVPKDRFLWRAIKI